MGHSVVKTYTVVKNVKFPKKKYLNNSPDEFVAVIDEVAVVETVEAATSVVGHFGIATREVQTEDLPTPTTTSSVLNRHEIVEAVEEGLAAVDVVADDRQAVVGLDSCHRVPMEKPVAVNKYNIR